jgi:aspartyl-tRNA(Asn)/glutamyl-tRNA(Gln) amidotransferase subunit A
VEIPDFPYHALTTTIIVSEAVTIFEDLIRSGKVDELADRQQAAGLKAGLEIPATEYLKAMRIRTLVQEAFRQMFLDVDMLLTPTLFNTATKVSDPVDRVSSPVPQPKSRGLRGMIPAGNLAGLPALSLPCGFVEGMPVAISLVGRPFSENHMIGLGRAFQSRTVWHRRRPSVE